MTPWIILIMLTSVGTVLLLAPFLRHPAAAAARDVAAALDELTALEQRAAAGGVTPEQAEATRAEVRRRILPANWAAPPVRPSIRNGRTSATLAGVAILGAVGFYVAFGSLDIFDDGRGVPHAARQDDSDGAAAVTALAAAIAQAPPQPFAVQQEGQQRRTLGSVDEMIERLVARLRRNPGDVEGWRMLGWSYFNTERFDAAAEAYAKAIDLSADKADLRSAYGEALVRAAGGTVTDHARSAFQEALRIDAKDARARFFMGLRKVQDGDKRAALDDWIAILKETNSKEAWFADLTQRVAELGQQLHVDVSASLRRENIGTSGGVLRLLDQP